MNLPAQPYPRFFNTAGPVNCADHYCLPPLERLNLPEILQLIQQKKYFVLHAPRQVGKTSFLLALTQYLNQSGQFTCLYVNVEVAQTAREDVSRGVRAILSQLGQEAQYHLRDDFLAQIWPEILDVHGADAALNKVLSRWAAHHITPSILLIDEIDSLVGDTLISVLRQLRSGYARRPTAFPQSVILCGVRDVRDYRIYSSEGRDMIAGGSAFNIKAESLRMGDFTQGEVETLCQQHTRETGQVFQPQALALMWALTQGQPWLVNALAYEVTDRLVDGRNHAKPITPDMVIQARENLILRRETHLDQLIHKLQEERVRRVIGPMLQGVDLSEAVRQDDIQYLLDLGLVRRVQPQGLVIANPIYQEIIPRELSYITQLNLESQQRTAWYVGANGRLDLHKLLIAFQQFFREHSEHWVERFDYKEAGPQLLLQAFLQRIVNGGGRVEREYGLGRQRTDLALFWPYDRGVQTAVIELKLWRKSRGQTIEQGLGQTAAYMDKIGTTDGHLVIFDRRPEISWEEKIFRAEMAHEGKRIVVWGM
ncbi:MAG: ATP-binding protein [Anaerolinea sp.]|nr:ATP-binding protein [Anaerolinea sp.]